MTKPAQVPGNDRQIRVFVSSTFRDMHVERDYLAKFVFPELRALCESRGVTWTDVDLRWGVTDEQKAEGKVLPICMEEIRLCRPFFIGLLGERYGWIPHAIPEELLHREPWLQVQLQGRKSVTELEIVHGVLREQGMRGRAYFYFRDQSYLATVPADKRKDFIAEDDDSARKLRELKVQIRQAGAANLCVVREGYKDPKVLGRAIRRDFTRLINELFPAASPQDPLDREAIDHEAYAKSRARVYISRADYFRQLDSHAGGSGNLPLVILGESGSGKSALLANWVTHYHQSHPTELVLQHYIGATPYSADWTLMIRRIMGELQRHCDIREDIPSTPEALRRAFPNWLHMVSLKGRVVLVLDALNQLEDRHGALDLVWLPPVTPENVRVIVSTLPGRSLVETRRRMWPEMFVEPLDLIERSQLIENYLAQSAKKLGPTRLDRIARAAQSANPLYLRVLLNELRLLGKHEELDEFISYCLEAESPLELYGKVIDRWETDYGQGTGMVGDALSLLWAARLGLSESELLQLLGNGREPLPRAVWSPLFLAMADALVNRGGKLALAHEFLRTATHVAYIATEPLEQSVHLRLADYFEKQPDTSPRRTDELPWQLAQARSWKRLAEVLSDHKFFATSWRHDQCEVRAYWTMIEQESDLRIVDVFRQSIDHPEEVVNKDFLPELASLLQTTSHTGESLKVWSIVNHHFRTTGQASRLAGSLSGEAGLLIDSGHHDEAIAILREAEGIARRFGDHKALAWSLCLQARVLYTRDDTHYLGGRHINNAVKLLKEAQMLFRRSGDLTGLASSFRGEALMLYDSRRFDEALALNAEAEQVFRTMGHWDGLASTLSSRAVIQIGATRLDDALASLSEAEQLFRRMGDLEGLGTCIDNRANILGEHGRLAEALAAHREAEALFRQTGMVEGVANSLSSQAYCLWKLGMPKDGLPILREARKLALSRGFYARANKILIMLEAVRKAAGEAPGHEQT